MCHVFFYLPEVITLQRSQSLRDSVCSGAAPQAAIDSSALSQTSGCSLAPMVRRICRLEQRDSENDVGDLSSYPWFCGRTYL